MKKIILFLGAVVLGFMLSSCENKKNIAINMFNSYFDQEEAIFSQVEDADAFLEYLDGVDERFDKFYNELNEKCPLDEDDNIIGLSEADNDAAMKVFSDRLDAFAELRDAKGVALYEPYIADLENYWYGDIAEMFDEYETLENIPEEVFNAVNGKYQEKFSLAQKYAMLSDDDQYDRFLYFVADETEDEE